jgi:hypothetical protein
MLNRAVATFDLDGGTVPVKAAPIAPRLPNPATPLAPKAPVRVKKPRDNGEAKDEWQTF